MTAGAEPTRLSNEQAEARCRNGVDLVDLYSMDPDLVNDHDLESVCLYAQLLEATILTLYSAARQPTDIPAVRDAARTTAAAWRSRR